jgi:molybdopterin molybdotransferase
MKTVDETRALILSSVDVLPAELVAAIDAAGRVLAEDRVAGWPLPGFDNSAMDGVGVRSADVSTASPTAPVTLRLVGAALPGAPEHPGPLGPGQAVRIMTGGAIPPGVDAVVMRESTDESGIGGSSASEGVVRVLEAARPDQHIRRRGEDVRIGAIVGRRGDVVTPARLNLLLAVRQTTLPVVRRPIVAVLASGDELREVGEPASTPWGPHDVVNSNAHAIAAAVRAMGAEAHLLGIARDTLTDHVERLRPGLAADALITIGGVSMGTHDFVRPALEAHGCVLDVWKVAMRPGKPIAFGRRDGLRVFALPGNPVSALVGFELFVRPALDKMMGKTVGRPDAPIALTDAILVDGGFRKKTGIEVWARAVVTPVGASSGARHVRILDRQGSHQISGLADANALARFGADVESVDEGATIGVLPLT